MGIRIDGVMHEASCEVVDLIDSLNEERMDLHRRVTKLEWALRFYADPANWQTTGHPQIDAHDTAVNHDRGAVARQSLTHHNTTQEEE